MTTSTAPIEEIIDTIENMCRQANKATTPENNNAEESFEVMAYAQETNRFYIVIDPSGQMSSEIEDKYFTPGTEKNRFFILQVSQVASPFNIFATIVFAKELIPESDFKAIIRKYSKELMIADWDENIFVCYGHHDRMSSHIIYKGLQYVLSKRKMR